MSSKRFADYKVPLVILAVTLLVSGVVLHIERNHTAMLREEIETQNRLRMTSTRERVEEYLDGVYSNVLFVSTYPGLLSDNAQARAHIQSIFENRWVQHLLSEIYVIKSDFDGLRRPFATFAHSDKGDHELEEEVYEYSTQLEQIRRFLATPELCGQISSEIPLCVLHDDGTRVSGLVYSVPIRSGGDVVGIVAAMIPRHNLETMMEHGNYANMAVLTNERGDLYGCEDLPGSTRAWFRERLDAKGAQGFFSDAPEVFAVGNWTTLWTPVATTSSQQWWLAFQYDESVYLRGVRSDRFDGGWGMSAIILATGILLALLAFSVQRRLEERIGFLSERRRFEKEQHLMEGEALRAQKMESLAVMAGSIAHNFNNILGAVLGYHELLLEDLPPESAERQYVEDAQKATNRAAEMSTLMLTYVGQGKDVLETFDLSHVVETMLTSLSTTIPSRISQDVHLARGPGLVEGDPGQIEQLIMNLVANAIEAMGNDEGVLRVSTHGETCTRQYLAKTHFGEKLPPGEYLALEIADTGCGMDDATQAKAFDPFFTTRFVGRGLGLAAVQGIVRGHRGAIELESRPGEGTRVRILLPAVSASEAKFAAEADGDATGADERTVLFVDDEEMARAIAANLLTRIGFKVVTASNGQEAVDIFRQRADEIDCVLLDLCMPQMDGVQAFEEIRQIRSNVPIIVITGYGAEQAEDRFSGKDIAGILYKPFRLGELAAKTREALRG